MGFGDEVTAAQQQGGVLNTTTSNVKFNTGLFDIINATGGYGGIPLTEAKQIVRYATPNDAVDPTKPVSQSNPTWGDYDAWLKANDPQQYAGLRKTMKAAGYSSWSSVLKGASFTSSPLNDFLSQQAQVNKSLGNGPGSGGPYTTRTSNVSLSSESSAGATLEPAYQSELGRGATDAEVKKFQRALNAQQMASPSQSVTHGNSSGKSSTSQSTTTTGFDPTKFATKYAQSQEGYAERYAGLTFMNILDKSIADPNSLDQIIAGGK